MKYRIEFAGRGGEIVIGKVKREFYDILEENELDIADYAWDSDFFEENDVEIDEDIRPFEPGEWFDCDSIAHNCGPALEDCYITVTDENDIVIHDYASAVDMMDLGTEYHSEENYPQETLNDGDVYFVGQSIEKGLFQAYEFEAESFDPTKLLLQVEDCDGWELVIGASYDGNELDDLGELSTTGKGSEFQLILVEKD